MPRFSKPYCPADYNYENDGTGDLKDYKLCKLDLTTRVKKYIGSDDDTKTGYIVINKDGKEIAYGSDKKDLIWYSNDRYEKLEKKDECGNKKKQDCIKLGDVYPYYIGDNDNTKIRLRPTNSKDEYYKIKPFSFHGKKSKKTRKSKKSKKKY